MKVTNETKLFMVEFGKPDRGDGWAYMGGSHPLFYILANDYATACQKAMVAYQEWKDNRPVLDADGSLALAYSNNNQDENVGIKNIKLACDKIIF